MNAVHLIKWAGQPDLQFACDASWSTPAYGSAETPAEGVYLSDDEPPRLYTFDAEKVTCSVCAAQQASKAAP